MAKATQKGIPVTVSGTLWGRDVTVGRTPGAAVILEATKYGTKLSVNTTKVTTKTAAQTIQQDVYCGCDGMYKALDPVKKSMLDPYFRAIRGKPFDSVAPHTVFMKLCLKQLLELNAFLHHSHLTYFTVCNNTASQWNNTCITLFGYPYDRPDGYDIAVYQVSGVSWKVGRKKYEPYMLSTVLIPVIPSPGKVNVYLTGQMPGQCTTLAVYSGHP